MGAGIVLSEGEPRRITKEVGGIGSEGLSVGNAVIIADCVILPAPPVCANLPGMKTILCNQARAL